MATRKEKTESVDSTTEVLKNEKTNNKPAKNAGGIGIVNCTKLKVRDKPSTEDSNVVTIIGKGEQVKIQFIEDNPEWYKVHTQTGFDGYSMSEFIDLV